MRWKPLHWAVTNSQQIGAGAEKKAKKRKSDEHCTCENLTASVLNLSLVRLCLDYDFDNVDGSYDDVDDDNDDAVC